MLERCRQWHTWLDAMPGELRQINDGVEHQVNIVINNLLYDAAAVAGLLTHLHDKYPFTQSTFPARCTWACGCAAE